MKKNFLGAFWLLLVLGICQAILSTAYWRFLYQRASGLYGSPMLSRVNLLRVYAWPLTVLAEASVYWLIRRRNRFQALSWAHSVIFTFAFLLNLLFTYLRIMYYRVDDFGGRTSRREVMHEQLYFFWALVIIAHLGFVAVLANCARKEEPASDSGEGENLLDDVVL